MLSDLDYLRAPHPTSAEYTRSTSFQPFGLVVALLHCGPIVDAGLDPEAGNVELRGLKKYGCRVHMPRWLQVAKYEARL